jgi:plasmid stabilization system protein ParE
MEYVRKEKSYLARHNRHASRAITAQIKNAIALIAEYPQAGAIVSPVDAVRRFVSAPYHLDYTIGADAIFIVAIRHGRQSLQDLEKDDGSELVGPDGD